MDVVDFGELRRQIHNLTQRDLIRLGEELGWNVRPGRGKGSHVFMVKGDRATTVPHRPGPGTVRSILAAFEAEWRQADGQD